jgi:DNA sulfur modification protein DndD
MKLNKIQLVNFRQFKSASFDFATGQGANLTLIHGEMGHGKTALLNAFRWVLHGRNGVKSTLTDPEYIVNSQLAQSGPDSEAKVVLSFDRNVEDVGNLNVVVERVISAADQDIDQRAAGRLKATITNQTNPAAAIDNLESASAQNFINAILPEGILDILFFDGEGVDKLVSERNAQLVEAVRTILGFNVIEAAVADLYAAKKHFESKRKQNAGEALVRKIEAIDLMKANRERHRKNTNDLKVRISHLQRDRESLESDLSRHEEVRLLVEKRIELRAKVAEKKKVLGEAHKSIRAFLRKNAFSLLSARLADEGVRLERAFREQGDFPAPISRDFIQELINRGACICGSSLCEGNEARGKVQAYLNIARDSKFHEAATSVGLALRDLYGKRSENLQELKTLRTLYLSAFGEIIEDEEEIESLDSQIGEDPRDVVLKLQKRSYDIGREIADHERDVREAVEIEIPRLDSEIEKGERELSLLEAKQRETLVAGRRISLIQAAIDKLNTSIVSATERLETTLNESIGSAFSSLSNIEGVAMVECASLVPGKLDTFLPYIMVRDADNNLVRETGMNKGRQQCLSLSLIKSLVSLAANPQRFSDRSLAVFSPHIYPIVIDAPFGVLTEDPAIKLARDLPNFANQVVCLINHAHYSLVSSELDRPGAVGRKYYIYHHFSALGNGTISTKRIAGVDVTVSGPSSGGVPNIYSDIRELSA